MLDVLVRCMNCGVVFDGNVEGYAEFLPEENHWESECGKCCGNYADAPQQDIKELKELLFAEDPFANAVGVDEDNLPF